MKTKLILSFFLAAGLFFACGKDKFETKPQLRIKSVSTSTVPVNGNIRFIIEFTDKEGDVNDSFLVKKLRVNSRVVSPRILDSFWTKVPDFPVATKGEIVVNLDYQSILSASNPPTVPGSSPPVKESDSLYVKFIVKDKKGNTSDTATSKLIVVQRQ